MKFISMTRLPLTALALATAALVGGCWDSNDEEQPTPPITQVPASAGASIAAFTSFLQALISDETSEPLSVEGFVAPVDEVSEVLPVI